MSSTFKIFQYTSNSCNVCCEAFDSEDGPNMSDAERSEKCKAECQCFCWPFCIVFDVASCPCRFTKHSIERCKKNTAESNTSTVIATQPK